MAKSRLQKEYEKELRLLERRIKALQKTTGISFSPQEIEAITRGKSRPRKIDIERVRALRGDELKNRVLKSTKAELPRGKSIPKVELNTTRTRVSPAQPYKKSKPVSKAKEKHTREILPEEVKKERKNFRARVRRLEKQGYDTSKLKPAKEYTTEELRQLKRKKLSEQAYKDGQSAYESRKQLQEQHRQFNKIQREADKTFFTAPPEPMDLPTAPDMIDFLTSVFEKLENHKGVDIREDKETLLALWNNILNRIGYPDNEKSVKEYNDYLMSKETEITPLCVQIEWDSDSEKVSVCFTTLFWILEKFQPLTLEESKKLNDVVERAVSLFGDLYGD